MARTASARSNDLSEKGSASACARTTACRGRRTLSNHCDAHRLDQATTRSAGRLIGRRSCTHVQKCCLRSFSAMPTDHGSKTRIGSPRRVGIAKPRSESYRVLRHRLACASPVERYCRSAAGARASGSADANAVALQRLGAALSCQCPSEVGEPSDREGRPGCDQECPALGPTHHDGCSRESKVWCVHTCLQSCWLRPDFPWLRRPFPYPEVADRKTDASVFHGRTIKNGTPFKGKIRTR